MDCKATIYAVYDPRRADKMRYVGLTFVGTNVHIKEHIKNAKSGKRSHTYNWLRKLLREGVDPAIKVLEIYPGASGQYWENVWWWALKLAGHPIINNEPSSNSPWPIFRGDSNGMRINPQASRWSRAWAEAHGKPVLRASGAQNGAYTKPERRPRGDRNGARIKPECMPRGDDHWTNRHPEWKAKLGLKVRGFLHGSHTKPESRNYGAKNGMYRRMVKGLTQQQIDDVLHLRYDCQWSLNRICHTLKMTRRLVERICAREIVQPPSG